MPKMVLVFKLRSSKFDLSTWDALPTTIHFFTFLVIVKKLSALISLNTTVLSNIIQETSYHFKKYSKRYPFLRYNESNRRHFLSFLQKSTSSRSAKLKLQHPHRSASNLNLFVAGQWEYNTEECVAASLLSVTEPVKCPQDTHIFSCIIIYFIQ